MPQRTLTWLWVSATVSFLAGLILLILGNLAGAFFLILVIAISSMALNGKRLAETRPRMTRWLLIGLVILFLLTIAAIVIVTLLR